jgi:hypothetical protein
MQVQRVVQPGHVDQALGGAVDFLRRAAPALADQALAQLGARRAPPFCTTFSDDMVEAFRLVRGQPGADQRHHGRDHGHALLFDQAEDLGRVRAGASTTVPPV